MINKILSIIPARGGSKGIPRKNIKELVGKPLIAWTIQAAQESHALDRIIVSTDDEEISQVSQKFGAEVPFLRPSELASDTAKSIDVVIHLLKKLAADEKYFPDAVMLLQPTSPLRKSTDILAVIKLLQENKAADAVISVSLVEHPITWLKEMDTDGKLNPLFETSSIFRRQDGKQVYQLNGSIYLLKTTVIQKELTFLPKNTYGYVMPFENSIDIDTPMDFRIADLIMRENNA